MENKALNNAIELASQMISDKPEAINDLKKGIAKSKTLEETEDIETDDAVVNYRALQDKKYKRDAEIEKVKSKGKILQDTIKVLFPIAAPFLYLSLEKSFGSLGAAATVLTTGSAIAAYAFNVIDKVVNKKVSKLRTAPLSEDTKLLKKMYMTENKRKTIIADKEKAIIESFAKTYNKIKRIDENEVSDLQTIELEKKAFDFANSAEMDKIANDILSKMSPDEINALKNNLNQLNEGAIYENDFAKFAGLVDTLQSTMNENDAKGGLKVAVGNLLSRFGRLNAAFLGTLPIIVNGAMNSMGLTNEFLGRGEGMLAMVASLIGGAILWRLGDKLRGKEGKI